MWRFLWLVSVAAVIDTACADLSPVNNEDRVRSSCETMFKRFPGELDGRTTEQAIDDCVRADTEELQDPTP